jgi:hypothetical protein
MSLAGSEHTQFDQILPDTLTVVIRPFHSLTQL